VAQAEWHDAGKTGEPYWVLNDPEYRFMDAELTPLGITQAKQLRDRTSLFMPQLMVVSPMRRAIQTGLLAFEAHVNGGLTVLASEHAHEIAGKHTCDKRLSLTALKGHFPAVDFSAVEAEEDPFWGDGATRETHEEVAHRAACLLAYLLVDRPETHICVAAHSTILAAVMAAVLVLPEDDTDSPWLGTGEMRTFIVTAEAIESI
jgi:broad specificity phosphatase PhoE